MSKTSDATPEIQQQILNMKARIKQRAQSIATTVLPQREQTLLEKLFHNGKPPVGPREFIDSPEFFGDQDRQIVYPWVKDTLEDIFSGEYHASKYQTAAIVAGKGSGKSYLAGLSLAYMWYWLLSFKDFGLFLKLRGISFDAESSTITFLGMAPSREQAKYIVFNYGTQFITRVKALEKNKWLPDPDVKNELHYNVEDPVFARKFTKVQVLPGNSSSSFSLGYNVLFGVIDEAAFWKEKHTDKAEELYLEMHRRQHSRFQNNGLIILISSTNVDGDFIEQFEGEAETNPDIYFKRMSLYDCKPDYKGLPTFDFHTKRERADGTIENIVLHPPVVLQREYEKNPIQALKDIDSIPTVAGSPVYPDFVMLTSKINPTRTDPAPDKGKDVPEGPMDVFTNLPAWFHGLPSTEYFIHVDLSKGQVIKGQCGCGFAMAHRVVDPTFGWKIVLDLSVRFKTPQHHDINVNEILTVIRLLKTNKGFGIKKVTFDKWNSLQPIQTINEWRCGIEAKECSVGYKEHMFLKNLIIGGQFDMYLDTNLLFELKRLEDYGTTIDHAAGAYKDEADAVAGAAAGAGLLEPTEETIRPRAIVGGLVGGHGPYSQIRAGVTVANYRAGNPSLGRYRGF